MASHPLIARLSSNSLWLFVSRLGAQAGTAVFTILLARSLGAGGFGAYAFMASIVAIGNVLTTFGTDMHLIREIAADDDLAGLPAALVIQLVLSTIFILVVFVASQRFPAPTADTSSALRLYSLSMLPLAFYTVFTAALRGRQHMLDYSLLNLAMMGMQLLAAAWLYISRGSLLELAGLLLLVQVAAALLAGVLCARRLPDFARVWDFSLQSTVRLVLFSAPIALLGILGIIYQRAGVVMLPSLAGVTATGWFSAAARLIEAAKLGHVAVYTAIFPLMAQGSRLSGAASWRPFRLPGILLLGGALLAAALLGILAGWLVPLLYGPGYEPAVPAIRILAWTLVPYSINSFLTLAFLARHQQATIAAGLSAGIVTLVSLLLWWAPASGIIGLAWASLCAEIIQSVVLIRADSRGTHFIRSMLSPAPTVPTDAVIQAN